MVEYMKWRGDLGFERSPVNEIDALIFSQLSYLHFRDALGDMAAPLQAAAGRVEALEREPGNAQLVADRHALLGSAAASDRFGSLTVHHCVDWFDADREMQFAAVTIDLPVGSHIIAYRGTDATVVGWKEDFNMSFACPVPSQTEAVRYLNSLAAATAGPLILSGHSKGGNLAMYAAACCDETVRSRIEALYLFDAPGLDEATLASEGYRLALPKVKAYVPQTSVIGQLMGVPKVYTVVRSSANGISQHNPFTWGLNGPHFDTLPALDQTSKLMKATIDDFLSDSTPEKRQLLVETLFNVLGAANAHTFGEMGERWSDTAGALWDAFRKLDNRTLKTALSIVGDLAGSGVDSVKQFISGTIDQLSANRDNGAATGAANSAPPAATVGAANGIPPATTSGAANGVQPVAVSQTQGISNATVAEAGAGGAGDNGTLSSGAETLRRLILALRERSPRKSE